MISIRASSLDDFPACQRRWAARWLMEAQHDLAQEFGLKRTRRNIGAVVGTAVHTGVAYLLNEFKTTGSHGGVLRLRQAKHAASEDLHKAGKEPVTTDSTTKTVDQGMIATGKILTRYHEDVRHEHEPLLVEKGLKLEHKTVAGLPYQLTGTLDHYVINATLEDTKTGVHRPKPFGQFGGYSLVIKANELPLKRGKIRYGKRVGNNVQQPPIEPIDIDPGQCERHALRIAELAAGGLHRMLETGNPEVFLANPKDMLCSDKYCPAWGTEMCVFGGAI